MLILIFFGGILHQGKRYFYLCKIRIREDVFVFHTIASLYWDPWHGVLGLSIVVSLALEASFGSLSKLVLYISHNFVRGPTPAHMYVCLYSEELYTYNVYPKYESMFKSNSFTVLSNNLS